MLKYSDALNLQYDHMEDGTLVFEDGIVYQSYEIRLIESDKADIQAIHRIKVFFAGGEYIGRPPKRSFKQMMFEAMQKTNPEFAKDIAYKYKHY